MRYLPQLLTMRATKLPQWSANEYFSEEYFLHSQNCIWNEVRRHIFKFSFLHFDFDGDIDDSYLMEKTFRHFNTLNGIRNLKGYISIPPIINYVLRPPFLFASNSIEVIFFAVCLHIAPAL